MRFLLLCLGLIATTAQAQVPIEPGAGPGGAAPPIAAPAAPASMPVAARPALARYGVLFDTAFPDGFALAFAYRPHWAVRLSAGGTYNLIGAGIRGGVSAVPFQTAVTPSLSLDAGHVFSSDMGTAVRLFADKIPEALQPLFKSVSYDYVDLLLGLEVGSQRRFNFYLKAGVTWIWATAHGTGTYQTTSGAGTTTVTTTWTATDPSVNPVMPSVKLGFIYWIH